MTEIDDITLVQETLKGDTRKYELLVGRYQHVVYNLAYRISHSSDDAQDITQAVFLKVFERLDSFNVRLKFFSWLYRIAVNESLNAIRHRKRMDPLPEEIRDPEAANQSEDSSESKVQDALMELKVDQRAVVLLKHCEGLSYQEISQIMDISEKKVKSRLFSARIALRGILRRKGVTAHG